MVTERRDHAVGSSVNLTAAKRILLAIAAGICLAASFPPYHLPAIIPVGVFLMLRATRGAEVRFAGYLGFLTGAIFYGLTVYWLWNIFQAAAIALIAILASFIMLFSILNTWLTRRFPMVPEWLIAAVLWTGIEYFRSEPFSLNFGWMGLGYSMVGLPVVGLMASWIGSYGLSFLIVSIGATLVYQNQYKHRRFVVPIMLILWCAIFIPLPYAAPDLPGDKLIRLIQTGGEDAEDILQLARKDQPRDAAQLNAIILPEYTFLVDPVRDTRLKGNLEALSRDTKATLVFGGKDYFDSSDPNRYRNTAYVLAPDGRMLGTHVKNHPIHFFNDGVRGTEAKAIDTPLGRIGVAICFDMDYPEVARKLAQDGAEVFLIPNMDPPHWGRIQREQHRLMFAMRAAECGKWLARYVRG
jgi:apolipoprotein N-acyltransferase